MPYDYLGDIAIADVAFRAWASSMEEAFVAAGEALMNVMVTNLDSIQPRTQRTIRLDGDTAEGLLFDFLQELIYYKDAERLLLRVEEVEIHARGGILRLCAEAVGEPVTAGRHDLIADVKAVTLHRFQLEETGDGWQSVVVVDI